VPHVGALLAYPLAGLAGPRSGYDVAVPLIFAGLARNKKAKTGTLGGREKKR
jgi:hypothetical protein